MPTLKDEQARRRATIDAGIASARLSGLDIPPAYEAEAARYVAGGCSRVSSAKGSWNFRE